MSAVWEALEGKKTIISAVLAILYGLWFEEPQSVLMGMGFLGLRFAKK